MHSVIRKMDKQQGPTGSYSTGNYIRYPVINHKGKEHKKCIYVNIYIYMKAMATHSSILAWKIPWTEEPGGLQSMGSLRVGHNWMTSLSLFTFMHWKRKWQPTPVFLPGESQGRGSLGQSQTRLKQLSSSSSSSSIYVGITLLYSRN